MHIFPLQNFSTQIALIDGDNDRVLTYTELLKASYDFDFGHDRSLIFLFMRNRVEDVAAYIGAMNAGHVVCLLDANMPLNFKEKLVEIYHPHYIIDVSDVSWKNYELINVSVYRSIDSKRAPKLHPRLQLLLTTSGTTGNPKLIRLSKDNVLSNAASIIEYLKITEKDRSIASLPFHYSYGLSVLHSHLLAGASIILTQSSPAQKPFWDLIDKHQCTSLAGVPYTYKLMDRLGIHQLSLPSIRTMTQAGGKLEVDLVKKFHAYMENKDGKFFVMYGQTEATARIAYLPPNELPEKANAIGIAIPKGHLKIMDENKQLTTVDTVGELVYEGPNVMLGYANDASDLAKDDELYGVLRTGDLGYFDEDGIFFISGRIKRISKVYGLRINLDDLEQSLSQFGNVAVTSTDAIIKIYIENGTEDTCAKCIEYASKRYQLHPSTFQSISIAKIPRTSSDKTDYKSL